MASNVIGIFFLSFRFHQLPNVTQELADVQNSDLGNFNLLQDIDEVSITSSHSVK